MVAIELVVTGPGGVYLYTQVMHDAAAWWQHLSCVVVVVCKWKEEPGGLENFKILAGDTS